MNKEISLLVISHKPNKLSAVLTFLSRRGVVCAVANSVADAFGVVSKKRPDFVMLSWNLPNTNIQKSLSIMQQTFSLEVIVFSETSDNKTMSLMGAIQNAHILHGPISGPKVYMRIQKILKERVDAESALRNSSSNGVKKISSDGKDETITISSYKDSNKDSHVFSGQKDDGKDSIIYQKGNRGEQFQFNSGSSQSGKDQESGDKNKGSWTQSKDLDPEGQYRKSQGGEFKGAIDRQGSQESDSKNFQFGEGEKATENKKGNLDSTSPKARKNRELSPDLSKEGLEPELASLDPESESKADDKIGDVESIDLDLDRKESSSSERDKEGESQENSSGLIPSRQRFIPHIPGQTVVGLSKKEKKSELPKVSGAQPSSILAQTTAMVLKETTKPSLNDPNPISKTEKLAVITVNSNRFKGYLLTAFGKNKSLEKSLIDEMKSKLMGHLKNQGEASEDEATFSVDIQSQAFNGWAEEFADFLALAQEGDDEIAMAFISGDDALPVTADSKEAHMLAIETKDVLPEAIVDFDVFLYMPKNFKYIRYLKEGGYMSFRQLELMQKRNVKYLHIRKEDLEKFKMYCGKNYIKAKFRESEKVVKKSS